MRAQTFDLAALHWYECLIMKVALLLQICNGDPSSRDMYLIVTLFSLFVPFFGAQLSLSDWNPSHDLAKNLFVQMGKVFSYPTLALHMHVP